MYLLFAELFQELFRQDLLVASLFRNFLLAERIMRSYNCTPLSQPQLPPTYHHPLWDSWDMALDHCLSQLRGIVEGTATYQVRICLIKGTVSSIKDTGVNYYFIPLSLAK